MKIFIILLCLFLVSCADKDIEIAYSPGIYIGDFSFDGGSSTSTTALVSKSFELRFILSGGHVLVNNISELSSSSVTLEFYQGSDTFIFKEHSISTIFSDNPDFIGDISGTWATDNGEQEGSISFSKTDKNEVSQSLVADSYNWISQFGSSGGNTTRVNITTNSSGNISGSDDLGCVYSGSFDPINGVEGVYPIALVVSSCGDQNGEYKGLTAIDPYQDSLIIMVSDESKSATLYMNR